MGHSGTLGARVFMARPDWKRNSRQLAVGVGANGHVLRSLWSAHIGRVCSVVASAGRILAPSRKGKYGSRNDVWFVTRNWRLWEQLFPRDRIIVLTLSFLRWRG